MMTRYESKLGPDGRKVSRRLREETIVTTDGTTERLELEERDQEEYYYVNSHAETPIQRHSSLDSNTVTVNYPTDDRLYTTTSRYSETEQTERSEEYYWSEEREHRFGDEIDFQLKDEHERRQRLEERERQRKELLQKEIRKQELLERERQQQKLLEQKHRQEEIRKEELRQQEIREEEQQEIRERERRQQELERETREKERKELFEKEIRERERRQQKLLEKKTQERERRQKEIIEREIREKEKRQQEIRERERCQEELRRQEREERQRFYQQQREQQLREQRIREEREEKTREERERHLREQQARDVCTEEDRRYEEGHYQNHRGRMPIDYSPTDFRQSLAAIDAASRDGIRISRQGDTTILTEHRDPYSFYWQLDQARRHEEEPMRAPPPTDYVIDEETIAETVLSPDSHDSGINVERENVESQYSRPMRIEEPPPMKPLPLGWEKHQDPSGYSYYWHVDSGTIQREPPRGETHTPQPGGRKSPPSQAPPTHVPVQVHNREIQVDAPTAPPVQQVIQMPPQQPVIEEHAFKQTTTKRRIENEAQSDNDGEDDFGKPVRFAVRSLGWTEIPEEDLTAERSSRAVNKAIVDLSTGRNDIMDNVSKWGDGRELIMELDDNDLTLIDPDTMAVVHSERIQQIRVWGVGRDNGRDFAYVARDRNTRRFMCHVFRCDTPARTIANTLRDICKRLMLQHRPNTLSSLERPERRVITRETSLPTPIEEPKKIIRCHFLGVTQVPRATGIEVLNEAVDRLVSQVLPERWILADVAIAPSTITISEVNGNQIAQCRVRYLSFLGIGRDVKHCAFIMHTSSENFMCYVFHVEPSAGTMAKTIEAACKLRYQKVLDAHSSGRIPPHGKVWGESLWDAIGSLRNRFLSR